ncbi:MAG: hypothetical protein ACFNUE_07980 [Bacteroides sp.]
MQCAATRILQPPYLRMGLYPLENGWLGMGRQIEDGEVRIVNE